MARPGRCGRLAAMAAFMMVVAVSACVDRHEESQAYGTWVGARRFVPPLALAGLLDPRIEDTCLTTLPWPVASQADPAVWDRPIPPTIFQIWLGGPAGQWQPRLDAWREHARSLNFNYRLITDADVPALLLEGGPQFADAYNSLRQAREFRGASDLLRYLLLARWGGIYIDADVRVPTFAGAEIPLTSIMPMRGLVVVTDGTPVDWSTGGLHLLNGFIASCPGHPTLEALVAALPTNIACCHQVGNFNPVVMTGPVPLNLLLTGPATIIPTVFWASVDVADGEWF